MTFQSGYRLVSGDDLNAMQTSGPTGPTGSTGTTGATGAGAPVGVPASAAAAGVAGTWSYDATHIYVCVATNTWVRATTAAW